MSTCDFCHGKPVQNAASWADGKPRPPAACPRCGRVSVEGQDEKLREREKALQWATVEARRERDTAQARGAVLVEALKEKQAVIDFAAQALRASEQVGGPTVREAWHLAMVALTDAETEKTGHNPLAGVVEAEPDGSER